LANSQKAFLRAAGGLLLAGSLSLVCPAMRGQAAAKSGTSQSAPVAHNTSGSNASRNSTSTSLKKKSTKRKSTRVKAQTAPAPDRIREIQTALANAGTYQGEPNGNWDAATIAAMQKFQQSNGLTPTGKLDALSLQKLGLGSETAGKGAPRPAATSLTSSSSRSEHR